MESRFGQLTPVCLTSLCSNLPLADLLSCAQVNRHWRTEVIAFCQINVQSVRISNVDNRNPHKTYSPLNIEHQDYAHLLTNEDGSRMFPNQNQEEGYLVSLDKALGFPVSLADSLGQCLSHLSKLTVNLETLEDSTLFGLMELISRTTLLISLKITIGYIQFSTETIRKERIRQLFIAINSLQKLEKLNLEFRNDPLDVEPNLWCFAWLHEIHFQCNDNRDILRRSLFDYAVSNGRLRTITYRIKDMNYYGRMLLLGYGESTPGRKLANHFTVCPFTSDFSQVDLPRFVTLLPSLSYINLGHMNYPNWHSTIRRLANLSGLRHLLVTDYQPEFDEIDDPEPIDALVRLPSVCTLEFKSMGATDHDQLARYQLYRYFPRLQALRLQYETSHPNVMCGNCLREFDSALKAGRFGNPKQAKQAALVDCARAVIADWRSTLKYFKLNFRIIDLDDIFVEL